MKISVVITTYNRKASLEQCLKSLAEQTFPAGDFEVVVVADGCTDRSVEFLNAYKPPHAFRWLSQENRGQPAAQNTGVAAASGHIIIFMDDDCICDPRFVAAHEAAHQGKDRIVAIGAVLAHPETPCGTPGDLKRRVELDEFARLRRSGTSRSDLMLCANSSIARQAALECPFDTTYKRMHDVEAGLRLWSKGFRPAFAPEAVVYELFTKPVCAMLSDARHQGRLEVLLAQRYPEFKPQAALVRINEGSFVKRWMRRRIARYAVVSGFALRAVYAVSERLRGIPAFSRVAHRVLRARIGLEHLRAGVEAAGSYAELENRFGKRIPVLIYHNVGEPRPGEYPGLTTPRHEFEAQIRLLSRMGYTAILPSDWLRWRDEGGELPSRPVMLVFDDGYEEMALVGFPILLRHGFTAACMIVTSCIGGTNRWDEEAGRPSFRMMSSEQILEWSQKGIEFGSHTSTHPELPFETEERVELEFARSKEELSTILNKQPVAFSYPFGSLSVAAQTAVRRHFRIGFTSWPGRLHLATDPALAPRIAFLPGESRFGMWCRLRLGRNPMEVARNRWKRMLGRSNHD